jgi:TolA-binding protein
MNNVTHDEFETVKELLGSAARYAESAHRGLNQLELAQQRSQLQIDELATMQRQSQLKLDELAEAQKKTEQRLESFVFEVQRLMSGHAERISQLEGISGRLEAILSYIVRKEGPGE